MRTGPIHDDSSCNAAGFVLAGGQSSRMGRDKALLPFAGQPLIARSLSILREADLSAAIAGASPHSFSSLTAYAPVVEDRQCGLGPLSGICAAFASVSARYAVFLPVDLPLLPPSLISYLLHHARITGQAVTVASVNGFTQTFPAVLDRVILPALENEMQAGCRGCFSAFEAAAAGLGQSVTSIGTEILAQSGQVVDPLSLPPVRWFLNVNTPQDLEHAQAFLTPGIA